MFLKYIIQYSVSRDGDKEAIYYKDIDCPKN